MRFTSSNSLKSIFFSALELFKKKKKLVSFECCLIYAWILMAIPNGYPLDSMQIKWLKKKNVIFIFAAYIFAIQ